MIRIASVAFAATLGLSALSLNKPASAGVVVGVRLPVPAVTIGANIPAVALAPAVYPYAYTFVGGSYYRPWRYRYPYYFGYHYGWHRGYGWRPGYGGHGGYFRGPTWRDWHR